MKYLFLIITCFVSMTYGQNLKVLDDKIVVDGDLYKFQPSSMPPFAIANRININPHTSLEDVIDTLIIMLNNYEYFKNDNISFELNKIEKIELPNKIFHIAIVNMLDKNKVALTKHFQGSTGGAVTSMAIISNLLQPQLYKPLLDGLIITCNNSALSDMDHISFNRIITPSGDFHLVKQAIKASKH